MKHRILKLTPEALLRALEGKPAQLNLPTDLELIDIKYDAFSKQVTAVIRSDSFEDLAENQPIPELNLDAPAQPNATACESTPAPVIAQKTPTPTHPTPVAPQKTIIQTLTASTQYTTTSSSGVKTLAPKPDSGQDTGGLEGEFTKEQRKVLRFVADGDFVIIKPIHFLKNEWEDINDTVKSIGGKWTKGDIIDYWIVPKNPKKEEQ